MKIPDRADDELLAAYQEGDETAATMLFERYYRRLVALARKHSGRQMRGVEDSVDLAQSVFQSLFLRCRKQQITVGPDQSLWPLLATITLNKARNRGKFHRRQRRDRRREVRLENSDPLECGPSPDDAALLEELIDELVAPFGERRQKILRMLLDGNPLAEIAEAVGTSTRTIYKTQQAAMQILTEILVKE